MGGRWVHLRLCMTCGHVGCCDSSPNKHATAHFHAEATRSCSRTSRVRTGGGATRRRGLRGRRRSLVLPHLRLTMGHPAILTVDDDPSVSRAIARDLRRRYGEEYRIIRASSAAEALDALQGDQAARRPGGRHAGRLPDAADERHRVPRAGDGPVPQRPARAADRVRGHRRRDPGDQRGRRRPLPAQAVGPAGGEALPGDRRAARRLAGDRRPRGRGHPGRRAPVERAVVPDPRLPGPQPGAVPVARRRRAGGPAAARGGRRRPGVGPAGGHRGRPGDGAADHRRGGRGGRACPPRRTATSTT